MVQRGRPPNIRGTGVEMNRRPPELPRSLGTSVIAALAEMVRVPKRSHWTGIGIVTRLIPVVVAGYLADYAIQWSARAGLSAVGVDAYDPGALFVVRWPLQILALAIIGSAAARGAGSWRGDPRVGMSHLVIGVLAAAVPTVAAPPLIDGLLGPISGVAEALVVLAIYASLTVVVVIAAFAVLGWPRPTYRPHTRPELYAGYYRLIRRLYRDGVSPATRGALFSEVASLDRFRDPQTAEFIDLFQADMHDVVEGHPTADRARGDAFWRRRIRMAECFQELWPDA